MKHQVLSTHTRVEFDVSRQRFSLQRNRLNQAAVHISTQEVNLTPLSRRKAENCAKGHQIREGSLSAWGVLSTKLPPFFFQVKIISRPRKNARRRQAKNDTSEVDRTTSNQINSKTTQVIPLGTNVQTERHITRAINL